MLQDNQIIDTKQPKKVQNNHKVTYFDHKLMKTKLKRQNNHKGTAL